MTDTKQINQKIHQVIMGAQQFREEQFRLILEGLIKRGGKDSEFLLVRYISNPELPHETRSNLIRITGYIRNIMYLMPLKKIIDAEPNIKLKKAAIIALSKFDDERALNILNSTLQTIQNPILLKTIHEKINLIRQHHPVLALTPRFLKGSTDMKAFTVSLGILKKILKPSDARSFIKYIDSDDPLIGKGVFEILCYAADHTVVKEVLKYIEERFTNEPNRSEPKCDDLFILTVSLKYYLERFPQLVTPNFELLKSLFGMVIDQRIHKIVITILCQTKKQEILDFVKEIYEKMDGLKECIIEATAGNSQAVEFLFEKYHSGKALKEKVVHSLLQSSQGFDYFVEHFFSFQPQEQEMIVRNLPASQKPELIAFIRTIFQSEQTNLKKYLMNAIRRSYLYNFRKVLLDPAKEEEFFEMEEDYVSTISTLFPVAGAKQIMSRISKGDISLTTLKSYMEFLHNAAKLDLILTFNSDDDGQFLLKLMTQIININNAEVTFTFLDALAHFKTFDNSTYRHFLDIINHFIKVKTEDENLTEEDKIGIRKVKENLRNCFEDIKHINTVEKDIRLMLLKSVPDLLQLKRYIDSNGLALSFKIHPLTTLLTEFFKSVDEKNIAKWRGFFKGFPLLTRLVREARVKTGQTKTGSDDITSTSLHDILRVVVNFEEEEIVALFKDQFKELVPHIKISIADPHLEATDILLCDSNTLKTYIDRKSLTTKRTYVLLKSKEEFEQFKGYNIRTFQKPISVFAVMRQILSEFYLMRPEL